MFEQYFVLPQGISLKSGHQVSQFPPQAFPLKFIPPETSFVEKMPLYAAKQELNFNICSKHN